MAITLASKTPSEVADRAWIVPLYEGEDVASFTATVASGTITVEDSQAIDGAVVLVVSGGADGETAAVTLSALSTSGLTYEETVYIPVEARGNRQTSTARDVCKFALRRVTGIGEEPEAAELSDAMERLNDLLMHWRSTGADTGANLPLEESDVLFVPDGYVRTIKHALLIELAEFYGDAVPVSSQMAVRDGLAAIRVDNLPDSRLSAEYF